MLRTQYVFWLVASWLWPAVAPAQSAVAQVQPGRDSELQQLRQRIQDLEKALHGRGRPQEPREKVAEIGSRSRAPEPVQIVRVYDVGDLFVVAPSYPAMHESDLGQSRSYFPGAPENGGPTARPTGVGGGFGGGGLGGPMRSVPVVPPAEPIAPQFGGFGGGGSGSGEGLGLRLSLQDLIDAIQGTISPASWDTVGGANAIETLGNALIVSADESVHTQIGELIELLRTRWGTLRIVSLRAYWLWLTEAELNALLASDVRPGERPFQGAVNRRAWQELLVRQLAGKHPKSAGYRAALACYNGQTVHVVTGDYRLSVTGLDPVVAQASVGLKPETSVLHSGAVLQVTPTATLSGKYVVLDLHSRVTQVREASVQRGQVGATDLQVDGVHLAIATDDRPRAEPSLVATASDQPGDRRARPAHPALQVSAIDRPVLAQHRLSTTTRVPVDRPVLVGGMTDTGGDAATTTALYLFVEAHVQDLREAAVREDGPNAPKEKDSAEKGRED